VHHLLSIQALADAHVTGTDATLESSSSPRADSHAHDRPVTGSNSFAARDLQRSDVEALIGRDYVGLRTLIFRRTGDPQAAADLLNDAICTAWEKYREGRLERPEQICGYIFQVAMNHLRNRRRSAGERADLRANASVIDTLGAEDAADDFDQDGRVTDQVIRIIRSMESARDRTLLIRFYLDEEDKEIICRDLRLTPAQFATILHRARRRLKELLKRHGLDRSDVFSWLL